MRALEEGERSMINGLLTEKRKLLRTFWNELLAVKKYSQAWHALIRDRELIMDEIDKDLAKFGWSYSYPDHGNRGRAFAASYPGYCNRIADTGRQFFCINCTGCGKPFEKDDLIEERR